MAYRDARLWRKILVWAAIAAAVYFGNVQLQTWLGHRSFEATGLEPRGLQAGLAEAQTSDRLVLANLAAIWCSSCRTFDSKVLADASVRAEIDAQYVFVRIEYESDEGKEFRERYDVDGFPRLVVLDKDGELVRVLPTSYDPVVVRAALRSP